jgi:acetyl esterase
MIDSRLDPQIRKFLEEAEAAGGPPLESLPPVEARLAAIEGLANWKGEPEPLANVEDRTIEGPEGPIPIRIYTPDCAAPRPALVYFHGGGWVVCDLDTHDVICRAIARQAGAVVVAVDYRLAPEHQFPAAVIDSYAATCWVAEHAEELGVDRRRLAVGGDSAGGNLAAVMALRSRDEAGPAIALQVLVYPVTDLSSFGTQSYRDFAEGYGLTAAEMEWFRGHYLAPALVITAEFDPLRDEGEAYARRLRDAGVEVRCTRYDGMVHPFFSLSGGVRQAREAIAEVAAAVAVGRV